MLQRESRHRGQRGTVFLKTLRSESAPRCSRPLSKRCPKLRRFGRSVKNTPRQDSLARLDDPSWRDKHDEIVCWCVQECCCDTEQSDVLVSFFSLQAATTNNVRATANGGVPAKTPSRSPNATSLTAHGWCPYFCTRVSVTLSVRIRVVCGSPSVDLISRSSSAVPADGCCGASCSPAGLSFSVGGGAIEMWCGHGAHLRDPSFSFHGPRD